MEEVAWPSRYGRSIRTSSPESAASILARVSIGPWSPRSRRRSTATRWWCFATSVSMIRNCATSLANSARWRSAEGLHAAGRRRLAHPEIGDISNLDEDGRLRQRDDRRRLDSLGNWLWHSDASYMPVPVVLGMLYAVAVPPASALGGGETEF